MTTRAEVQGSSGAHPPYLSVIIPAYNEERRLPPSLARILTWTAAQPWPCEVLVVDDGSRDATAEVVRRAAAQDPRLRLISNDRNRGKGYTVAHGARQAHGDLILFSDADLSTPIEEALKLEAAIRAGADIAIASRALPDSNLPKRQPGYREWAGRLFNLLVRAALVPGIHDTQCGFKLFTRAAAQATFPLRQVNGFAFDIELLFIARRLGFRVAEVPVTWINDEDSRVNMRNALRAFADIPKVRWTHRHLTPAAAPSPPGRP
jgi:glycosyltransferase involved in cell wall biosynthesis